MSDGEPGTTSCPRCGRPVDSGDVQFCLSCGWETADRGASPVLGDAPRPTGSSRFTWALLTLAGVLAAGTLAVATLSGGDTDGGTPARAATSSPHRSTDGSLDEPAVPGEIGEVVVIGEDLPAVLPGEDTAIGMRAPDIQGFGFDGTPVAIDNGDRIPKAIVFLAHWCPHCQAEVPRVQEWLDGGGGVDGVEIVSVATAVSPGQSNYPPSEWLDREGWTAPVLRDDEEGTSHQAYGFGGFPFWVFVDVDGRVVRRSEGELDIEVLEQFLREIAQIAA
jgi:thiol-disulfide isomerase/thioredoxin